MITVIGRPIGHKLTDAELSATVTDSGGDALFNTLFAHGLQDGDYVYVQSNLESYNGYKYVDSTAYNGFKLRESEEGDFVPFKQQIDVTYRISVLAHGWLAISQPIVYELHTDLWPVNEDDISYNNRVIDSTADAEGYTQLNLSSALTDPEELDFIELVGDGALAGAYQILTVLQPWSVIINLAYDASNSFSGYEVVKYYNNYCINVEIWSGLDTDHPWYSEKPYELAATLRFTPDGEGRVKFSISDILKGYIETRNNLTLDTLPNNLDFMTGFYIRYYETYDQSDGDEISTLTGPTLSDKTEFEGHAVNSDMPFKSLYISHMSEYLNEDTYFAKWLVLQSNPVVVIGHYFDLSFINSIPGADILIFGNGELLMTIEDPGIGVIRVPIEPSVAGQLCITAHTDDHTEYVTEEPTPIDLSLMTNEPAGGDLPNWTTGAEPFILGQTDSDNLSYAMSLPMGVPLKINYRILIENKTGMFGQFIFETLDGAFAAVNQVAVTANTNGLYEGQVTLPGPPSAADYLTITFSNAGVWDMYVQMISFGDSSEVPVSVPGVQITEEICLTVLEECDSTFIPDDDIRLTEDGDFRILE